MKRIIKLIPIILILITPIGSILLRTREETYNRKLSRVYASKLVVTPKEDYDLNRLEEVKDRLSLVPCGLLEELYIEKIKIKPIKGSITDLPEFASFKGKTIEGLNIGYDEVNGVYGNFTIALRIDKGYGYGTELHEVGHALDFHVFNFASSSKEFEDILLREGNKVFNNSNNNYYISNSREYFAQCFCLYYLGEDSRRQLKKKAPDTYEYINRLVKNK